MFERAVAAVLNRCLGKYIQDLDTENLNGGIFSGQVELHDLKIKPEALYELDLPIEVKVGAVGKLSLTIPWSSLYSQPVVITIEEIYIIASPVFGRPYDPEKEKRLERSSKRKQLEDLEDDSILGQAPTDSSFIENLVTTIVNNVQVYVRNVHIRYEDAVSNPDTPLACGICIQSLSIETTNSKWKPMVTPSGASSLYQLVRMEALSLYWNPRCPITGGLVAPEPDAPPYWVLEMRRGIDTFTINQHEFEFLVKPITAKIKVIVNKSNEARVPKLLVDLVLQDIAAQMSRQQYLSILALIDSFRRMAINRKFRRFRPEVPVAGNSSLWWKYAYTSMLELRVRPYTFKHMKKHRENYRNYKNSYKQTLLKPTDSELRLDTQLCEDLLDIEHIVVAREEAKIELRREAPEKVTTHTCSPRWWQWQSRDSFDKNSPLTELRIVADKGRGLWAQLTSADKAKLFQSIGHVEGPKPEKPKQYIEHKVNVTLANCSLSLINRGREVLVATITQFLASAETRPSAHAFKLSARVDSIIVEGSSLEHDLIPIFTGDNNAVCGGNGAPNVLAIDFEKNPLNLEADYGLSIGLEPIELMYHEHALSELFSFFQTHSLSLLQVLKEAKKRITPLFHSGNKLAKYALSRRGRFNLLLDIHGPYLVVPEHGTLQRSGSVFVCDFGRILIKSDLQPLGQCLDDATLMELEERLYDRLHIDITDVQMLFCDSGEEWREARRHQDTEHHLIPKVRCQLVFSNSIKPDYRQLPRHKLNLSISSLKMNLSDRRIGMILDFIDNVPLPSGNTVLSAEAEDTIALVPIDEELLTAQIWALTDLMQPPASYKQLVAIRAIVALAELSREARIAYEEEGLKNKSNLSQMDRTRAKDALLHVDKSFISLEHSDEEAEQWARTVDLPGFDDNVSPNNVITMLLRFVIGEVVIQLARSNNRIDKPYLMLRVADLCWDTALMEYGPAVQASLASVHLIDKLHVGQGGEYLELVSTCEPDLATILYRKVRSDCPDFKSHFHSVEQSLVLDLTSFSILFHREAFSTLNKYLQYLAQKFQSRESHIKAFYTKASKEIRKTFSGGDDPPIPPGATKFSYSTRLGEARIRLCETDMDFLDIKVAGIESDCLFKANERMVLRVYLTTLCVDDLSDLTLYPKVIAIEEEKVAEFKYVRHSPKLYTQTSIESGREKDDVKADGSLRIHIGRLNIVVLYKLLIDLQHFLEPFLVASVAISSAWRFAERKILEQMAMLRGWSTRLHLSLDIHTPNLLLPQKSGSPNLIIFNLGEICVENFFKEMSHIQMQSEKGSPVIDNVLFRLENLQVSRAVMTLAGSLEIQEPIVEPVSLRLDIKRMVAYHNTLNSLPAPASPYMQAATQRDLLLYEIHGGLDAVRINLGQRDLATMLAVWSDNFAEGHHMEIRPHCSLSSPAEPSSPTPIQPDDHAVRKLQMFLCQGEIVRKEATIRLTLDGLQLYLFNDLDEILSSPVRDLNHGLCKLELGEVTCSTNWLSDRSLELKMSLQSCMLSDIRTDNTITIRKILQSLGSERHLEASPISVSTPPIIDLTYRQSAAGDRCLNMVIEKTRLNLSGTFFVHLGRFLLDALPSGDGGLVNHGYDGDLSASQQTKTPLAQTQRPPSSADSTSGYFSSGASCTDEQPGLAVSIQLRNPEVMVYGGGLTSGANRGHALLLRTELLLEYSRHPGRSALVCSFSALHILSKLQGFKRQPLHKVLLPCDVEFSRSIKSIEEGVKVTVSVSPIDIHLAPSTIHTLWDVIDDMTSLLQVDEPDIPSAMIYGFQSFYSHHHHHTKEHRDDQDDLWSPKKLQPYVILDKCESESMLRGENPSASMYGREVPTIETFTLAIPKFCLAVETEQRCPVLLFKAALECHIHNWSRQMHVHAEIQLQASYLNERIDAWEPFIEPKVEEEGVYRPWEVLVKVFQAKAYPISSRLDHENSKETENNRTNFKHKRCNLEHKHDESETSGEEADGSEDGMTFIRRRDALDPTHITKRTTDLNSLAGYPDDSDSENEEGLLEKLAGAIGHLFTGDSSDEDGSASDDSSAAEPSVHTEEASDITASGATTIVGRDERAIFLNKKKTSMGSVDSGLEAEAPDNLATYWLLDARDRLEITVTPALVRVLNLLTESLQRNRPRTIPSMDPPLSVTNYLGPNSLVQLLGRPETAADDVPPQVILSAPYGHDSAPSSPGSVAARDDASSGESDLDIESFEGGFNVAHRQVAKKREIWSPVLRFPVDSVTLLYNKVTEQRLLVRIDGFDNMHVVAPFRAVSKMHTLQPQRNNTRYHVIVQVEIEKGRRTITVRSPLQIKNETCYAMGIYYNKSVLDNLSVEHIGESTNPFDDKIRMTIVEPDETYNVPLFVAYHCRLRLLPAYLDTSASISEQSLWWQEFASDLNTPRDIVCPSKEGDDATVFSCRAVCTSGTPVSRHGGPGRTVPNYLIRLVPPLTFLNRLPYATEIKLPVIGHEVRIEAGESANLYMLDLQRQHKIGVDVPVYLGIPWSGSFNLTPDLEEKTITMATEYDTEGGNKQLGLSLHVERTDTCSIQIHAPYWIVNKTGLPLQLRGSSSDIVYEAQGEEPLLFCFKKHRRRCVRLRAYHSSWSSAFSLDAAGCAGLIVCKDKERRRVYRILLNVALSKLCPQLTRIITFLPNFIVTNASSRHLRYMEENERADLWIDLSPGHCMSFWPETDSMRMFVKFRDSKLLSQHFGITYAQRTVLRMDKGGALVVDVSGGGDQPFCITFKDYSHGDAPVRVDNMCEDLFLKIHQQDLGQVALLSPYQSLLYTWDDPSSECCLFWNVYNNKSKGFPAELIKDGFGQERVSFHTVKQPNNNSHTVLSSSTSVESPPPKLTNSFKLSVPKTPGIIEPSSSSDDSESEEHNRPQMKKTRKDKVVVYWVSYLEGRQRVLLLTQDERLAQHIRRRICAERSNFELVLSLAGIGVSLNMDSDSGQRELAYLSLTDSAPVWEVMVSHKWKPLSLELAAWLENKWRHDAVKAHMKDYVHIDLEKMVLSKPFFGELRRRYTPALWLQFRKSEHYTYTHFKLHRLQLDNQLHDAVFPAVVYPTPLAAHIRKRVGVPPCIQLAFMKRSGSNYNQHIYKFIKILVQEMTVQFDKGFLTSLYLILPALHRDSSPSVRIRHDIAVIHLPISAMPRKTDPASFTIIEHLHVGPLKVQLSLSLQGSAHPDLKPCVFRADVIEFLLNSFNHNFIEAKSVRLKLTYLEQRGAIASPWEVCSSIYQHYATQFLQQIYVSVLAMDVLGNPYAHYFTTGFDDFYEPFLAALESPDEFAEGLSHSAQVLMGHVFGGDTIGSPTLISGSVSDILPQLNFEQDYKKKRRFSLQQPSDVPELITEASKTFTLGVVLGLSGVIVKPMMFSGPQDSVEAFFKGPGKGLLGLMTKPTAGIQDLIGMASDGVKRAIEIGDDMITRTRLPRFVNPYTGAKPFSLLQATGLLLMNTIAKGHYADSDIYWMHAPLVNDASTIVLVTMQHVFLVSKCRLWGPWEVDWHVRVDDIMAVPHVLANKLILKVRQDEIYSVTTGGERVIECADPRVLDWIQANIETVLILNMEDKPCPAEL